ncbi:hypothetical protein H2203_006681 [Taxawa tesnikishii (nom. ined.)]|nr:hypothetical protein H2203_006681 [Dothideales sp. JES 119]
MQTTFMKLVTRDDSDSSSTLTPTMADLLIVLLVLVIVALVSVIGLYFIRNRRRQQNDHHGLPVYEEKRSSAPSNHGRSRHFTLKPSESIYVYQEKQNLIANSSSPPTSPIPEIRITFPEEVDDAGKRQSGRVVVVRVGEHSVGMEPVTENLPHTNRANRTASNRSTLTG